MITTVWHCCVVLCCGVVCDCVCGAQAWCCAGLYSALVRLASFGCMPDEVTGLLDEPRKFIQELVAIGLTIVGVQSPTVYAASVTVSPPHNFVSCTTFR